MKLFEIDDILFCVELWSNACGEHHQSLGTVVVIVSRSKVRVQQGLACLFGLPCSALCHDRRALRSFKTCVRHAIWDLIIDAVLVRPVIIDVRCQHRFL